MNLSDEDTCPKPNLTAKEKRLARYRRYYLAHADKLREASRRYYSSHPENVREKRLRYYRAHPDKRRNRRYDLAHPEKVQERTLRWRKSNPIKVKAHKCVNSAIKQGTLIRPGTCSVCNATGRIDAHHHRGYDAEFWLDVQWLCRRCHRVADQLINGNPT